MEQTRSSEPCTGCGRTLLYVAATAKRPKLIAGSQAGRSTRPACRRRSRFNVKIGARALHPQSVTAASKLIFAGCNHQNPGLSGADALMNPWS